MKRIEEPSINLICLKTFTKTNLHEIIISTLEEKLNERRKVLEEMRGKFHLNNYEVVHHTMLVESTEAALNFAKEKYVKYLLE